MPDLRRAENEKGMTLGAGVFELLLSSEGATGVEVVPNVNVVVEGVVVAPNALVEGFAADIPNRPEVGGGVEALALPNSPPLG